MESETGEGTGKEADGQESAGLEAAMVEAAEGEAAGGEAAVTGCLECPRQYCIPLEQEQRKAYNTSLH